MVRKLRAAAVPLVLLGCVAVAFACGDDDDPAGTPSPDATTAATGSPSPSASPSASPDASPSAAASPSPDAPTASPSPTATEPPLSAGEAAQTALLGLSGGRIVPEGEPCTGSRTCIGANQSPEPERGLALFAVTNPGGAGAIAVMGRDGEGGWNLWYVTQNQDFHRLVLPGDVIVCGDGGPVTVYTQPDRAAPAAGQLDEGATATAETFQLQTATPWDETSEEAFFSGWYEVSGAASGWIEANNLADSSNGSCEVRDSFIAGRE